MISSIRNCISISFNHLVIYAKKLNSLTSRIKEYVIHKFEDIADCFKDISFLRNRRFNPSTTQINNKKVNQVATANLNPAISASQQPQSTTSLSAAQEPQSRVNQPPTTNLGSKSSESINSTVNNQLLTLDKLDQALKVWRNDPNVTGNKLEANQRIRQAFQNKSIDLDLSGLQLNNLPNIIGQFTQLESLDLADNKLEFLPAEIGHLTQLESLYLAINKLEFLPAEIGHLTQLKELYLRSNQLQALPAEIGHLTQLESLYLYNNNLQALPAEIGNLTQLQTLYLYNNNLQALSAEIGNLTQLQTLYLDHNLNLTELPLSLGELSEIPFISIQGTQISPEVRQSILAQCKAKRRGQDPFIPRLQKWFTIAGMTDVELAQFEAWDISHQNTTKEWLFRLEKTKDYQGNQKKLAQVVCKMLLSVVKDKTFKDLFMNQAEANNENCQDRSAMALNELYTAWKIQLMEKDQTSYLQDKVYLSIQAAKTLALRGCLRNRVLPKPLILDFGKIE